MSYRKYPSSQPRSEPQKCGRCGNSGHNQRSQDCPKKLINAETPKLIDHYSEDLNLLHGLEEQLIKESSSSSGSLPRQSESINDSSTHNSSLPPLNTQVVDNCVADYQRRLALRETELYTVSRESSCSMEVVTTTEHRAITLSKPFYDQVALSKSAASIPTYPTASPMDVVVDPRVNHQAPQALVACHPLFGSSQLNLRRGTIPAS